VTRKGVTDWPLHNGHITPYNPALLLKYQCHLNVEVCATVDAVKYIHKYICKGHDVALLKVIHELTCCIGCVYAMHRAPSSPMYRRGCVSNVHSPVSRKCTSHAVFTTHLTCMHR
jgi:hypothetical protein